MAVSGILGNFCGWSTLCAHYLIYWISRVSRCGVYTGWQDVIIGVCPKEDIKLVDSSIIHMDVSKINPWMYKYKYYRAKLQMAHYIFYLVFTYYLDNRINSIANTCTNTHPYIWLIFIRKKPTLIGGTLVIHNNPVNCTRN